MAWKDKLKKYYHYVKLVYIFKGELLLIKQNNVLCDSTLS